MYKSFIYPSKLKTLVKTQFASKVIQFKKTLEFKMPSIFVIHGTSLPCKIEFQVFIDGLWHNKSMIFWFQWSFNALNQFQGYWLLFNAIFVDIFMCCMMHNMNIEANNVMQVCVLCFFMIFLKLCWWFCFLEVFNKFVGFLMLIIDWRLQLRIDASWHLHVDQSMYVSRPFVGFCFIL